MVQIRQSSGNQPTAPIVVKLGGSLQYNIPDLVPVFRASNHPLLIVPGGGRFADAVRKADVDDDTAHWMAITAMEQYGWFIASFNIATTDLLHIPEHTTVFLPYQSLRIHDPLPHSWDVTSDTIAAWVADALGLDLLLLKSVDGIVKDASLQQQVNKYVVCDVVDPFFIPFVLKRKIQSTIINGLYPERVEKYLKGKPVPGTGIGTTF
jgi:aspartokinase-like uncharacterized kinase